MSKIEINWNDCGAVEHSKGSNMNEFTAIIRHDYRVSRESVYDLRIELERLAKLGLVKVEGPSRELLVVRGKEFIGWLSLSRDGYYGYDTCIDRADTERERELWQMLVDMLD